jgi:hypothetical protein
LEEHIYDEGGTPVLILTFVGEYFLFIFLSSLGILQIAASYTNLKGLSFFSRTAWGYIFGALLIVGGFSWFYIVGNRHPDVSYEITWLDLFRYGWFISVPDDTELVMGESEIVVVFLLAVGCVLLITIVLSSIVKFRILPGTPEDISGKAQEGLEVLKRMTFFQAITRNLRNRKRKE